ncbi:MAG: methyl-accepting chemotaxis protein [Nitrospinota bacterium]|nr:methyl-accepting chemotaxis protein [Nitrospinota bacterium]
MKPLDRPEGSSSTYDSKDDGLKWTIRKKLVTLFLIAGLVPLLSYSLISMSRVNSEIREISKSRLISLRDQKKQQIEDYFKFVQNQVLTFSEDHMVIDAMKEFSGAWDKILPEVGHNYGELQASKLRDRYNYQVKSTHGAESSSFNKWFPRDQTSQVLQSIYISENSNPIGEKHRLDYARDGSSYSQAHKQFHPTIRDYLEKFGYYDIFLVDAKTGNVVYSVYKEVDFATSLVDGPYSESGIGKAFKSAVSARDKGQFSMVDFSSYAPSYNGAASFISSPIFDNGELIGVLIFQAPVDNINMTMTSNNSWKEVGLGDSGEVYLVGSDFKMRNNSRFLIENPNGFYAMLKEVGVAQTVSEQMKALGTSIGFMEVKTQATEKALQGATGFDIIPDYRGVSVLSAFAPVKVMGVQWGIMAEIDKDEAFAVQDSLITMSLILAIVLIGLLVGFAMFIAGWFSKPILALCNRAREIVGGQLSQEPLRIGTTDELNLLGNNFNTLLSRLQGFISSSENILSGKETSSTNFNQEGDFQKSLEGMLQQSVQIKEANERELAQAEKLKSDVNEMLSVVNAASQGDLTREITISGQDAIGQMGEGLSKFIQDLRESISDINRNAQELAGASQQLTSTSQQMANNAEETSAQANSVSAASEQVSQNVETVATGTEEMGSSIKEIARNATEAATVVSKAVEITKQTNEMIQELGTSSTEVGDVIKVITSIAEQTNLLALNATIEAARAGEAGKGFAVVANEVKDLANQTAQATEDISRKIQDIQAKTTSSVEAIAEITQIIHQIDDISNTIASSVEEQTATTAEIGHNVGQAAKGTGDIANNISGVADAARNTAQGASETQKASGELSRMALELEKIVTRFKI